MVAGGRTPMNGLQGSGYRAYLLRCWQEAGAGPDGEPAWRFALVQAGDERHGRGFASLEALVAYLREELAAASGDDNATG
jgi:hypothetical protein